MSKRDVAVITEQRSCVVEGLTEDEAGALASLGQILRAQSSSQDDTSSDDEESESAPSIIQVDRRPGDRGWRVFVRNAVGVIGVGDMQIVVEPKIPLQHFDYLRTLATEPEHLRLAEGRNSTASSESFVASVWIAYLDALAVTLRADLHHDYVPVEDDPPFIRGRLDVRRTSMNLARGTLRFPTVYEDLSVDNPVNRVLRAACNHTAEVSGRILGGKPREQQSPQTEVYRKIQKRATEASYHLAQAGDLRPGDLETDVPRLAVHQERALHLAREMLTAVGRTLRVGDCAVSCFLYPTPPVAESGICRLLNDSLDGVTVSKRSRGAAGLNFTPDLVVLPSGHSGPVVATGDVKYRRRSEDWPRPVLEQAVVFAEVFGAGTGFFVDFDVVDPSRPSCTTTIDGRSYHRISWPATENVTPEDAAIHVVSEVRRLVTHHG